MYALGGVCLLSGCVGPSMVTLSMLSGTMTVVVAVVAAGASVCRQQLFSQSEAIRSSVV